MVLTYDWGCQCPPFWFPEPPDYERESDDLLRDTQIFPVFVEGIPGGAGATAHDVGGEFQLSGHFTGRRIDMYRWYEEQGRRRRPAMHDGIPDWEREHPEFHVHSWCYSPFRRRPDYPEYEIRETTALRADGAPLCAGTRWPAWLDEPIPAEDADDTDD